MNPKQLVIALPAAFLMLGNAPAKAAQTIDESGALACVTDKWDEKEPEKGHKLVDAADRCVDIPNDPAAAKYSQECVGKYEYMPDESWKGGGTCTDDYKGGDTKFETIEEGSASHRIRLQDHRWHRQISRRERRRDLQPRESDGHAEWWPVQGQLDLLP